MKFFVQPELKEEEIGIQHLTVAIQALSEQLKSLEAKLNAKFPNE